MALPAVKNAKSGARSDTTVRSASKGRAIPLDLATLIAPYKSHGRLSLRVEQLRQHARFSNGRNNGDRSWSLAMDELADLEYLLPTDNFEPHSLSVRVVSIDQGGMTLALLDVPVSGETPKPHHKPQAPRDDAAPSRQQAELEDLKGKVTERDAQIAGLKEKLDHALAQQFSMADSAATLEEKRGEWQAEFDARTREIQADADRKLEDARQAWQREAGDNLARARETWNAELAARVASEQQTAGEAALKREQALRAELVAAQSALAERDATLANKEQAWKAKEAESLSALESRLKAQAQQAVADADARCARAEAALASAQRQAGESESRETDRLRKELALAQAIIAERDAALVTRAAQRDTNEAELLRLRAELASAQKAMEDLRRVDAERAASQASAAALQSQAPSTDLAIAQAKDSWIQESEKALRDAKAEWAKSEAAKIAEAESRVQAKAAAVLAETQNRLQEAEQAIAELRAAPPPQPVRHELNREIEDLRTQVVDLQAEIAKRDTELARLRQFALENGFGYAETNAAPQRPRPRETAADGVEAQLKRSRHIAIDLALVFGVIALTVTFYPYIENFLPYSWSRQIDDATNSVGTSFNGLFSTDQAPVVAAAAPAAAPQAPALPTAGLTHAANLRSGPGVGSAAIATLQSSAKVAVLQQKGNWSLVRVEGVAGKAQQGWIYSSFLKSAGVPAPHKRGT